MTARTPLHRGAPNRHDRECGSRWCHICRHVGAHTPDGIAARKRRDRRAAMSHRNAEVRERLTEAARREWDALPEQSKAAYRRADEVAREEAEVILRGGPVLRVVEGGAG